MIVVGVTAASKSFAVCGGGLKVQTQCTVQVTRCELLGRGRLEGGRGEGLFSTAHADRRTFIGFFNQRVGIHTHTYANAHTRSLAPLCHATADATAGYSFFHLHKL